MQNQILRRNTQLWDFLEPAMNPDNAREDHIVIVPASAGTYVAYRKGQIMRQKDDGTNSWAKTGTAGYAGAPRIMKYSALVDDQGRYQMGDLPTWQASGRIFETGSIDAYYQGFFKTQDLVGAGGTAEVQTETMTATGGSRALSFMGYKTAAIPFNALLGAIKAALLAAVPVLASADITVAGTGPWTYTFGGAYTSNVPLIVVDPALLTGGTSAIVETTPGAVLLTGVGRLVRGTTSNGIMELGTGAPA